MDQETSYRANVLLKKAGVAIEFTEDNVKEFIKCKNDVCYFVENYVKIINLDKGLVKMKLYDFQRDILHLYNKNKLCILKMPRQSSKTTTTVAYFLWLSLFNEHHNIAILANKGSLAREILSRYQLAYENLPLWLQQGILVWNKGNIELENGSKLIAAATSSSAIRGYSFNTIFMDEVGHISNNIAEEFFTSVYPTISSGKNTKLIMSSCVTKDTYIFTPDGIRQIGDFINYDISDDPNRSYNIPRYSVYGMDGIRSGEYFCNNGKATTRIIKSSSSILECSLEHKLWAYKDGKFDWYKAKDLTENDYISIKYGENIWGNNDDISDYIPYKTNKHYTKLEIGQTITKEMAYFLGLFLSEGYARDPGQITLTCGDDISSTITNIGYNNFYYDGIHYSINSVELISFLKYFGFDINKKAKEKVIPKRLFSCSKEIICSFLSGFFDGDGCATSRGTISVISSSKELIFQIRILLLNLGLLSQYYTGVTPPTKKVKVESIYHRLEINDYKSCIKFYDEVGFKLQRKQQRKNLLSLPKRKTSSDIIPNARIFLESKNLNIIESPAFKHTLNVTRERCLTVDGVENFPDIFNKNLKWEKIKSIKESENEVYDFSLDHIENDKWCHSVLYNGIVGHQTPNGMNLFYKFWTDANANRNGFVPFTITWDRVPGRDQKWYEETLAAIGPVKFDQEYNTQFLGSSNTLISGEKLASLTYLEPINKFSDMIIYEEPIKAGYDDEGGMVSKDHNYFITVDVSEGKNLDYSAFSVFDGSVMPYKQVAVYRNNFISPILFPTIIKACATYYNNAYVLVEVNSNPQVAEILMTDLQYENTMRVYAGNAQAQSLTPYSTSKGKAGTMNGLRMSPLVKRVGCSTTKTLIENDKLLITDFNTISELTTFTQQKTSFAADEGCNDDMVMTIIIFSWMTTQPRFKEIVDKDIRLLLQEEHFKIKEEEQLLSFPIQPALESNYFIEDDTVWIEANSYDEYNKFVSDLFH